MLESLEAFRSHPYRDESGIWTIGYGSTSIDGKPVTATTLPISSYSAYLELSRTVDNLGLKVSELVPIYVSNKKLNALVVLVYNIGIGAFHGSNLFKAISQNEPEAQIRLHWGAWDKITVSTGPIPAHVTSEGLVKRRAAELALYFSDDSSDTANANGLALTGNP